MSNGRIYVWKAMLKVITENPKNFFIGTGWGSYWDYIPAATNKIAAAHSIYLKVLLEVGLIGFSFLVAFIFSLYRSIKKNYNYKNNFYYNCVICSLFILLWSASLSLLSHLLSIFALSISVMTRYLTLSFKSSEIVKKNKITESVL